MLIVSLLYVLLHLQTDEEDLPPQPSVKIEYRGKKITVDKFLELTKTVTTNQMRNQKAVKKLQGFAVKVDGVITKVTPNWWTMTFQDDEDVKPLEVLIDARRFKGSKIRRGLNLYVAGIVDAAQTGTVVTGVVWELKPPGLEWKYELENPGTILTGQSQTFVVRGVVANTGAQPFRSVTISVRLWRPNGANDVEREFLLKTITVGEAREWAVKLRIHNYVGTGGAAPRVAMRVIDYEL